MKKLTLSVLAVLFTFGLSFGQLRELDEGGAPNEEQVPDSRMDQHEAFLDGEYRYPAKPRNMWTIGLEGGYDQISGDVDPQFGWDLGINARKALGYATSIRFGVNYLRPKGSDDESSSPSTIVIGGTKDARLSAVSSNYASATSGLPTATEVVYQHEFNQKAFLPYAEFILNLNNINFHDEQTNWSFELGAGPAAYIFNTSSTFRNMRVGNQSFGTIEDVNIGNSEDTRADVIGGDDDDLNNGKYDIVAAATFSGNIGYRVNDRVALSLRPRYTRTWDDWLDGEAYQQTGINGVANSTYSPDKDQNFAVNLGLDFAVGSREKRTQPLWWENPLNMSYDILKDKYAFDDEYLFEDSDGDGVVDRLDKEPNSPCSFVDGGGVAIDSDKDGIVDCNDACPFTPAAQIAEIDENGCTPLPEDKNCCDETDDLKRRVAELEARPIVPPTPPCASKTYPSVTFGKNARKVATSQNGALAQIAGTLSSDPSCRIVIEGFATGRRKVATQVAWARAKAVADALQDTYGISGDRIIVRYSGVEGYGDVVMVRSARDGEYGSSNPAAPAPGQ